MPRVPVRVRQGRGARARARRSTAASWPTGSVPAGSARRRPTGRGRRSPPCRPPPARSPPGLPRPARSRASHARHGTRPGRRAASPARRRPTRPAARWARPAGPGRRGGVPQGSGPAARASPERAARNRRLAGVLRRARRNQDTSALAVGPGRLAARRLPDQRTGHVHAGGPPARVLELRERPHDAQVPADSAVGPLERRQPDPAAGLVQLPAPALDADAGGARRALSKAPARAVRAPGIAPRPYGGSPGGVGG